MLCSRTKALSLTVGPVGVNSEDCTHSPNNGGTGSPGMRRWEFCTAGVHSAWQAHGTLRGYHPTPTAYLSEWKVWVGSDERSGQAQALVYTQECLSGYSSHSCGAACPDDPAEEMTDQGIWPFLLHPHVRRPAGCSHSSDCIYPHHSPLRCHHGLPCLRERNHLRDFNITSE